MKVFQKGGPQNTEDVFAIVDFVIQDRGIKYVVVASTTGRTGLRAAEKFCPQGVKVVVVAHNVGHKEPGVFQFEPGIKEKIEALGAKVYVGTTVFESLDKALKQIGLSSQGKLIAATLRIIGQGVKVCAEIACSAVDAGLVPEGEDVICVAGTGKGADTALIIKAMPTNRFFELFVREILAKPGETRPEMLQREETK